MSATTTLILGSAASGWLTPIHSHEDQVVAGLLFSVQGSLTTSSGYLLAVWVLLLLDQREMGVRGLRWHWCRELTPTSESCADSRTKAAPVGGQSADFQLSDILAKGR